MKQLSELEYNVLMASIQLGYDAIADDTFIDPYNNEEGYTNEQMFEALQGAENKLIELWNTQK